MKLADNMFYKSGTQLIDGSCVIPSQFVSESTLKLSKSNRLLLGKHTTPI